MAQQGVLEAYYYVYSVLLHQVVGQCLTRPTFLFRSACIRCACEKRLDLRFTLPMSFLGSVLRQTIATA